MFIILLLALGLPLVGLLIPIIQKDDMGSDEWIAFAIVPFILAISLFVVLRMKTELNLYQDEIIFRFNPFIARKKTLKLSEIKNHYIADHKWRHGLGYKMTMDGGRVYVLSPGKVLVIETDKRKYRFGINRPEKVKRFIAENWEEKNKVYG